MAKILVVDDDIHVTKIIEEQLIPLGYSVISAYDGDEGLSLARSENPDLIILDVMLPKVNGYYICRTLKSDERFASIPIILLTARDTPEDKKITKEVKADLCITKPFNLEMLSDEIKRLLQS